LAENAQSRLGVKRGDAAPCLPSGRARRWFFRNLGENKWGQSPISEGWRNGIARATRLASLFHSFPVVDEGTSIRSGELVAFKNDGWLTMQRKLKRNTPTLD
jgi:hypothetical protein